MTVTKAFAAAITFGLWSQDCEFVTHQTRLDAACKSECSYCIEISCTKKLFTKIIVNLLHFGKRPNV